MDIPQEQAVDSSRQVNIAYLLSPDLSKLVQNPQYVNMFVDSPVVPVQLSIGNYGQESKGVINGAETTANVGGNCYYDEYIHKISLLQD